MDGVRRTVCAFIPAALLVALLTTAPAVAK